MVYTKINNKNLDKLYTNEKKIVLFTMNGCPYCEQLIKNEWKSIKQTYQKLPIFEVERGLLQNEIKNKIEGFPTIAILKDKRFIKTFSSTRTLENLEKFILSAKL
jgi:hypothetical protein